MTMPKMDATTTIMFSVPGRPKPWSRRVVNRRTGASFIPREVESYKSLVRDAFYAAVEGQPTEMLHDGPVTVMVHAFFPIPKSRPRWWRERAEIDRMPMTGRPDGDNVLKMILDALNSVAYGDDRQVYRVEIAKRYSPRPRCDVRIELREPPRKGAG